MKQATFCGLILVTFMLAGGAVLLSGDGLKFPHKPHIAQSIECVQCHKKIKSSTDTATGGDVPSRKICNECHDEATGYSKTVKLTYRQMYKFNHKIHVEGQGLGCRDCHEALYVKDTVTQKEIVPKMEYCFQCHDNVTATQYCMLCHINATKPDDHRVEWNKRHGKKADADKRECLACHTNKETCLRCHKGARGVSRYHDPNYEISHKYESRISLKHCRACHSERQCSDCHKSNGVSYMYPAIRQRHPAGWTNRLSPNFHSRKARLNIAACTTCHTKNECNYCHFWIKKKLFYLR